MVGSPKKKEGGKLHSHKLNENMQGTSKWHKVGTSQVQQAKSIIHDDDDECHKL
jgi:hypothetical protein